MSIETIIPIETLHISVKSIADSKWHMENMKLFIVKMPNLATAPESAFL